MTGLNARYARILIVAMLCCLGIAVVSSAGAQTITIIAASQSVTQARDGVTLTLGYQITSSANVMGQLTATLTGPNGEIARDTANDGAGYSYKILAGTNWYYRDFLINLPPSAANGLYDITYTVKWGSLSSNILQKPDVLTILAPIPVRCPILMYHKIGPQLYSQYWITTSMLQGQMAALKAYGYTPLTCRELMDIRAGLSPAPAKPIMLTFDGGYENFYTDALPAMAAHNYKSVMFLLTGCMGANNAWDGDNNPVINFMTWDQVTSVFNSGLVDLESHTVTHPDLTTASSTTIQQELTYSRRDIKSRYPTSVDFFCYPYGSYNSTVKTAVRDAGYFGAFAAWGGIETTCADKWALKRVPIYWDSTLDYSPSRPSSFFFNQIGDMDIRIPSITVNSVQYLDPVTGASIQGSGLAWGQTVKVRVTATNSGSAADVVASLTLDNDPNPNNGSPYDSHTTAPSQDIVVNSWTGQRTFEWLWQAPINAPTGLYLYKVGFLDKFYVLGFLRHGGNGFVVKSGLTPLETVKMVADGTWATIKGAVVTAAFPDSFYVETDTRNLGIRVEKSGHGIAPGTRVDVAGQITSNANGERCIAATIASPKGSGSIAPVFLANDAVGGGAFGLQEAVRGYRMVQNPTTHEWEREWKAASGLNNTGLLVRVCGRVKSVDASSGTMVINDGSSTDLKCVFSGVAIDPTWQYVTVTGISSCERIGTDIGRVILVVSALGVDDHSPH